MTGGYDRLENRLIAFEGEGVPEEAHFHIDGVIETRTKRAAAWLHAHAMITAAEYLDIQVCTLEGQPNNEVSLPEWAVVDGQVYLNRYSPARLARSAPAIVWSP